MPGLRPIHYRELEKFVQLMGCTFERQTASHRVYWRNDQVRPIVIPCYREVPTFVIRNILRQLRIPVSEYLRLVGKQ